MDESIRFAAFFIIVIIVLAAEEGAGCWGGDTGDRDAGAGGVRKDGS